MTTEKTRDYEYELIDICIDNGYEQCGEDNGWNACEDVLGEKPEQEILCDADGIPMGASMDEIRKREAIITEFLAKWREANVEGKVFNDILQDYIYVRAISIIEAKEHSSKSYLSTRALMILDEILKNLIYKHHEIGSIKLTVGVKKNQNKIQYGISALKPDELLVDYLEFKKPKKKRSPHK